MTYRLYKLLKYMVRKTCFFISYSFEYLKCWLDIIKKNKEGFKKRFRKSIEIFLTKRKIKSFNMLLNDIEIFLKKEKNKKYQHDQKLYKNLLEDKKQRLTIILGCGEVKTDSFESFDEI